MAANDELKVRCPSCGTKYKLPVSAVGRKVRCAKCHAAFRMTDPRGDSHRLPSPPDEQTSAPPRAASPQSSSTPDRPKPHPTEDEILRWLNEADDDAGRERRVEMNANHDATMTDRSPEMPPSTQPRLRIVRDTDSDDLLMMRRVV